MKVYLMPGMGAKSIIFKGLKWRPGIVPVPMEWIMPKKNETLSQYTGRLIERYRVEEGSVLLGMSFGGLIVREMAQAVPVRKLILISTIKFSDEMPVHYRLVRALRPGLWLPLFPVLNPAKTARVMPVKTFRKRLLLYEKYMAIRNPGYFRWAIERFLGWQSPPLKTPFIHLHGTADRILPVKYLKEPVRKFEGLSHLMVMTHPHKLNGVINAFLEE